MQYGKRGSIAYTMLDPHRLLASLAYLNADTVDLLNNHPSKPVPERNLGEAPAYKLLPYRCSDHAELGLLCLDQITGC